MAGYIGSKTSVTQVDGYNRTEADAEFVNDPNSVISVSGSNVGIGTSSPATALEVKTGSSGTQPLLTLYQADNTPSNKWGINFSRTTGSASADVVSKIYANREGGDATGLTFDVTDSGGTTSEAMRIDSSGNLLVGKTSDNNALEGISLAATGAVKATNASDLTGIFNRLTTDGDIVQFWKDGSTVGSIGNASANSIYIDGNGSALANLAFGGSSLIYPTADNVSDVGASSHRFDDIYATNGSIQTSDRNEKQDIEALSDAEQRVAVACKGLLRKFRWIDAVAEKGDDARIHFGIIAQDLQDAFSAEGLDAGRYAMFISSTWWEHDVEVPAVEADEENGIEAKEAYTRTDTYETLEEAPEGATERTRLGVRYPELLAFIIGAM